MKHGTININISKLAGYVKEYEEVTETQKDEETGEEIKVTKKVEKPAGNVKLVVTVDDVQVESKNVKKDAENVSVGFDGEGTVRIKIFIDDSLKRTKDLNLNSETTINIE